MSETHSLAELARRCLAFPGTDAPVRRFFVAFNCVEEEVERAAAQIAVRLRQRHAGLGQDLHPDDRALDEHELDEVVNVLIPKTICSGFFLTMWAGFEVAVRDLAEYAGHEKGVQIGDDPFRYGNLLENLEVVFTRTLRISAFPDVTIQGRIKELHLFRHALIHHDGKVDKLPNTLRRTVGSEYAEIGLHRFVDLRHEYVVPTPQFVHQALEDISRYLFDLSERVYSAVHPVPMRDDA